MSHGFYFVLGNFHGNSWAGYAKAVHNHNSVVPALIGDWLFCFVSLSFEEIFCFFCHFFWYRSLGISWDFILSPFFFVGKVGLSCFYGFCFWRFSLLISAVFLAVSFFSVVLAFFGLFPSLISLLWAFVGLLFMGLFVSFGVWNPFFFF